MYVVMVLPLSAAMVLGLFGARLGRGLPPSIAVPLLSLSALVTALASGFVLAVAGFIVLAQLPLVAAVGGWSAAAVRSGEPVPVGVGVLAGLAVSILIGSALHRAVPAGRDLADPAPAAPGIGC